MKQDRMDINRGMEEEQVRHSYPYLTLPDLKSHLHPKFVIFDAGKKLDKLYNQDIKSNPVYGKFVKDYPNAEKTRDLYIAWTRKPPDNAREDKTYYDPENYVILDGPVLQDIHDDLQLPDDDSEYEEGRAATRTVAWRCGDMPYVVPRTRSMGMAGDGNGQGGTTKKKGETTKKRKAPVKKRKVLSGSFSHNQQLLSEAALSRINQQLGEAPWTAERIRQWSFLPKKRRVVRSPPFL